MKFVIVAGGRNYGDYKAVEEILDSLKPDLVVSGGATGADGLALEWAFKHEVNALRVPAKWKKFGRAAGMKRNREMLDLVCDLAGYGSIQVVLMPGGVGTNGMADICYSQQAMGMNNIEILDHRGT